MFRCVTLNEGAEVGCAHEDPIVGPLGALLYFFFPVGVLFKISENANTRLTHV
jgi:hypothetical protein